MPSILPELREAGEAMSAMGDLRLLLLEHGVSYDEYGDGYTHWTYDGASYTAQQNIVGKLIVCNLTPAQAIEATLGPQITGETSDGYHTFNELYHHRAVLFSVIVRDHPHNAWKAKKHHDGTMYDGMFIVGIDTPQGQATYHYDIDPYWEMFNCKELDRAPEWDGHTPDDAIARIATLGREECEPVVTDCYDGLLPPFTVHCSACGDEWGFTPNYCPNCGRRVKR